MASVRRADETTERFSSCHDAGAKFSRCRLSICTLTSSLIREQHSYFIRSEKSPWLHWSPSDWFLSSGSESLHTDGQEVFVGGTVVPSINSTSVSKLYTHRNREYHQSPTREPFFSRVNHISRSYRDKSDRRVRQERFDLKGFAEDTRRPATSGLKTRSLNICTERYLTSAPSFSRPPFYSEVAAD
ncbi:hypothetical protein CSUI_000747 [Cystoisospora suis]|uniref:Uncharacterized protein n=1 Tax=Cystoisospora suis TaxID=483139 RepID=A0A2C6LFB1_9APIC|nr:hypothetical protein CSUI_000747 [Cystoisospora suis]